MNDSHFHLVDPKLPKGKAEGQLDHPENRVEALTPRVDCEHCITTGQGQPRKRTKEQTVREKALEAQLVDKDAEIARLRAQIEGRVDVGAQAGAMGDPDEAKWREQEAEEDAERARKRVEAEAKALKGKK